ncbi:uncharacterized protein [Antedon mediterranea]|uniref:uncharacterized protein n=1 Tax=Antedon mediterranea TaxID=105859 RepID=UPI003AF73735
MLLGVFGKMLAKDEYQLQTRLFKPSDEKTIEKEHKENGEQMLRQPIEILCMSEDMKITVEVLDQKWKIQEVSKEPQIVTAEYLRRTRPSKTFLLIRGNSLLKAKVLLSQKSNNIDPVPVFCVVDSKQNPGSSKDKNEGASLSNQCHPSEDNNTMADSETLNSFRDLKAGLSRCFDGERYHWLRFLLFDQLDVGDLTNKDFNGHDILNTLKDKGFISSTNVNLLLEITNTSEIQQAKDLVSKYMTDNNIQNRHTDDRTKLSPYRKRLFKALKQVDPDALRNVTAYYELKKYNLSNIWDAVLKLENRGELADDLDKIERFAERLGGIARNILLGNSGKDIASSSHQCEQSEALSNGDFEQLIKDFAKWFDERKLLNSLKVLFLEMVDDIEAVKRVTSTSDLLVLLINSDLLSRKRLAVLYDTIKVTEQFDFQPSITKKLSPFKNIKKCKVVSLHAVNLFDWGKSLDERYNFPNLKYADSWSLILDFVPRGLLSEDKIESIKKMLKDEKTVLGMIDKHC